MERPKLRVVVVDDSRDAADTLVATLETLGQDVRVAYDGDSAYACIREFQPDLAILDIGMPGMSGHELAKRLRADSAIGALRLVALTGYGLPADRKFALASGFDAHYAKPIDLAALEALLAETAAAREALSRPA